MQPPAAVPDPSPPAPVAVGAAARAPAMLAHRVGRPRLRRAARARLPVLPPLTIAAAGLRLHLHIFARHFLRIRGWESFQEETYQQEDHTLITATPHNGSNGKDCRP